MSTASYASPPSSVYSYATSTRSTRSTRSNDFAYNVGDHSSKSKWCNSASEKSRKYLRRLLKFKQMDFEFALWQMMHLFVSPQKVYRNFQYRKQTKNQFARDDPAFLVLLSLCFCATSVGFGLVMGLPVVKIFKLLLWVVLIDCIAVGIVIATIMWFISNRYLVLVSRVGQDVEWAYAFDVHLNAFFPVLMILHCLQLFFINPLIDKTWFVSTLVGNTFWLAALGYYIYITFLGYSVLPFVKKTVALLSPMILLCIVYFITIACNWNITRGLLWFYKHRV
uniref:Protein unc-50 homolog n=1 Tax=Phallusia mammillata TaxID=59560 RepID=A0A6F9DWG2_9ASCI|nr:protein unc-50 homolog [Phallusia mammillata]